MAYVYLIGEKNNPNLFKIGSTRKKNIIERLKQLQTGNPEELYIKEYFETSKPFLLENMLHRHYFKDNAFNEWFELNEEKVNGFNNACKKYQSIIESIKNNPFMR